MSDTIIISICIVIALPGILIGTGILALSILGALFPSRFGAGNAPSPKKDNDFENDFFILYLSFSSPRNWTQNTFDNPYINPYDTIDP